MKNQLEVLNERLFGPNGIGARNVNVFPGSGENVTKEQIATEINKALDRIEAGDFELIQDEQD